MMGGFLMVAGFLALVTVSSLARADDEAAVIDWLARQGLERVLLIRAVVVCGWGALLLGAALVATP